MPFFWLHDVQFCFPLKKLEQQSYFLKKLENGRIKVTQEMNRQLAFGEKRSFKIILQCSKAQRIVSKWSSSYEKTPEYNFLFIPLHCIRNLAQRRHIKEYSITHKP